MAPQYFNLQEANGLRVAVLQSYDNPINRPVGITCNAGVGPAPISPAQIPNGLPIVDPACNVAVSYTHLIRFFCNIITSKSSLRVKFALPPS